MIEDDFLDDYDEWIDDDDDVVMSTPLTLRHPNSQRFHDILLALGELHDRKQADYGRGDDPFANVRGSTEWGMPGWVGAMVRAQDKTRRLQQYARTAKLENEGVADSFMDLAVYAIIAMVLWEQDQRDEDERMARP